VIRRSNDAPSSVFIPVVDAGLAVRAGGGRTGGRGALGPHVTLVWPFLPARLLDEPAIARLGSIVSGRPCFSVAFDRTGRFPEAPYLAPDDPSPFVALVDAVVREWPEYPPYGGAYADMIPHVTLGSGAVDLEAVTSLLPIVVRVGEVHLAIHRRRRGWRTIAKLPLSAR
jgi:2'-5' RNA ligase